MNNDRQTLKKEKTIWVREETIVPILFGFYCVAYLIQVFGLPARSTRYPYLLMTSIFILFVFIFFQYIFSLRPKETSHELEKTASEGIGKHTLDTQRAAVAWKSLYKPVSIMVATFTYPYIMAVLGFTLTTSLFLVVLLRVFGTRQALTILAISLGFPLFLFFIMTFYLQITLPSFSLADLPLGL